MNRLKSKCLTSKRMPEGPEVLYQTDRLEEFLKRDGRWMLFVGFEVLTDKYDLDEDLLHAAVKFHVKDVYCKGKNFFIILEHGVVIHAHHMMSGKWRYEKPNIEGSKDRALIAKDSQYHVRLDFKHPDTGEKSSLWYCDSRFGKFQVLTSEEAMKIESSLAPGFIGRFLLTQEEWDEGYKVYTKKKGFRVLLHDQKKVCSGLGNYLACEIMYEAGIHPLCKMASIDAERWSSLFPIIKEVVEGHYNMTRELKVYCQDEDPEGRKVKRSNLKQRYVHYVEEVQTHGKPEE